MSFLWLGITACFPVILSVILAVIDRLTPFRKIKFLSRQIIIGLSFGAVAILQIALSTEAGMDILNGADAVPLCAGLVFGGPAGIIAGVIGGVFRFVAGTWGMGVFTKWACTISIILAGLYGAFVRKFFIENKLPTPILAFCAGVVMESVHYLLYFATNVSAYNVILAIIKETALPVILATSLSILISVIFAYIIYREREEKENKGKKRLPGIQNKIQNRMITAFAATLVFTVLFTFLVQANLSINSTKEILSLNVEDVKQEVQDQSDKNMLKIADRVKQDFLKGYELHELKNKYDVAEINYVNPNGIIRMSTNGSFLGFDMSSGEQSAEFLILLEDADSFVQPYGPISYDNSISRKYAGVSLSTGGFIQVGYDSKQFTEDIRDKINSVANNRHVGSSGYMVITNGTDIISAPSDFGGIDGEYLDGMISGQLKKNEVIYIKVAGEKCLALYDTAEGYYILAVMTYNEAFSGLIQTLILMGLVLILIFAILYGIVYIAIKRLVLNNIGKVSDSLTSIAGGNLDVTVDVHDNYEFDTLSFDINKTVDTLKGYTEEIKANYEKDMEIAKNIQASVLPGVLPHADDHKEIDLFSYMNTAREVGGDFFDYYWLSMTDLLVMVADVSGKGVPAAMFMMRAKTLIREAQEKGATLDEALTKINNQLCEGNDTGMFVTAWIAVIDITTGHVRFVNAGHNPPVIKYPGEEFKYLKGKAGFVLAGMENYKYKIQELDLTPGTIVYLYTDGVTEATNSCNRLYGDERLLNCLNSNGDRNMQEICEAVKKDIDLFVGDAPQFDDITMLAVQLKYYKKSDD